MLLDTTLRVVKLHELILLHLQEVGIGAKLLSELREQLRISDELKRAEDTALFRTCGGHLGGNVAQRGSMEPHQPTLASKSDTDSSQRSQPTGTEVSSSARRTESQVVAARPSAKTFISTEGLSDFEDRQRTDNSLTYSKTSISFCSTEVENSTLNKCAQSLVLKAKISKKDQETQTCSVPPRLPKKETAVDRPDAEAPQRSRARGQRRVVQKPERILRDFRETPARTVKFALTEAVKHLNVSGSACCPWHVALLVNKKVVKGMLASACDATYTPFSDWQCQKCFAMNEAFPEGEETDQIECAVCGEEANSEYADVESISSGSFSGAGSLTT